MTRRSILELRRRAGAAGQALVELALVLPLLLILLMGTIDAGRLLFTYIALEDAAQEGAIYSANEPFPASVIETRVKTSSNHPEVTGSTVTIVCTATTTTPPVTGTISVKATYPVQLLTPIGRIVFGNTLQLGATFIATNFKGTCA